MLLQKDLDSPIPWSGPGRTGGDPIIVNDSLNQHTMMDISTSFIQIAGGIRNSKYKNKVTQIFSSSRYGMDLPAEEYSCSDYQARQPEKDGVIPGDSRWSLKRSLNLDEGEIVGYCPAGNISGRINAESVNEYIIPKINHFCSSVGVIFLYLF